MKEYAQKSIENIQKEVQEKKVLLALSGGVDSSVCAVLLQKAIGSKLTCIFVDTGLMRKNEAAEVEALFTQQFKVNLIVVNAQKRFLDKLKGVTDPEQKRKIIGEEFIRVFEEEAKKLGKIEFLAQGTIYPDIVESGVGKNKLVKSHHNVGGLPKNIGFDGLIEPLKELYKEDVRALGLELGLPKNMVYRQPFPGPGLGVRVIGEITQEKLDVLRDADFIVREEIEKANLDIWQYFAVITDMRSVGVKNESRTYGTTIAIRAINTKDAITANFAKIPYEVLEVISARILDEVADVNRVVYDITNKPPATIEWE